MVLPLALTMGDPAGIGPEITQTAWQRLRQTGPVFYVIGDPTLFGMQTLCVIDKPADAAGCFADALPVLPLSLSASVVPGHPDQANAPAVIASIEQAVRHVQAGQAAAVVTNPISKAVLYSSGFAFPGHTEFLGALTGGTPVMMLASPLLRVVPVTVHVSLRHALDMLTTDLIVQTARITIDDLKSRFGLTSPRLAMAGLNPHAGEGGAMGEEEQTIIAPAMARLRQEGHTILGPYPPDTMFTDTARRNYDAALCMYHDQALIPLKTLDMRHGVNVTLGLPIIRTSPDHGTAFDIAGRGIAEADSLTAALRLAAEMATDS
ncbi:4-hydroxythreonine-4-phosphate dehydrogenase [Granulibacter bethesdensis]|uniref:4-hydroxythreonine-4-phosphate dehydrogenase n=1 Tax=Granulibacter bethesdensis TaxID=364410 RepID=A0AAC9P9A6_9PROT|nr:4-hydroxythreonine-4-phosphate dehydrogenase PdxA [Granulibacter bethesdensis]APH55383.1 4-hydroxythreonine-4-phosphate dehydrogenase [Granulibacter bethesdensis]APH62969.1 4-hydroxythreonine-4-phosphate dehydrogenase [Granulibacter bethesdensis]